MIFFQKKVRKNLQVPKNVSTFASQLRNKSLTSRLNNGIWCNGNTADSGPAFPGSSPGIPTKSSNISLATFFCLCRCLVESHAYARSLIYK